MEFQRQEVKSASATAAYSNSPGAWCKSRNLADNIASISVTLKKMEKKEKKETRSYWIFNWNGLHFFHMAQIICRILILFLLFKFLWENNNSEYIFGQWSI